MYTFEDQHSLPKMYHQKYQIIIKHLPGWWSVVIHDKPQQNKYNFIGIYFAVIALHLKTFCNSLYFQLKYKDIRMR